MNWTPLQQVAGKVHPAALPGATLQLPPDRLGQAHVGIADHELDRAQAALLERNQELAPEALVFAVADLEAEQLAAAVSVHAHGHYDGPGADLQGLAQAAVEVGGIEVDVGVTALLQRPVQEGLHLHVDVGADAADLGSGDAALHAQGCHQGIDLAGGDAADVGLHDDAVEGLIDAAAGLQDRGQVAARAQLGDHQVDVADLGGQAPRPVAIAVAEPIVTALVALGAEHGSNLQLDQLLQAVAHDLRDELLGRAAIE